MRDMRGLALALSIGLAVLCSPTSAVATDANPQPVVRNGRDIVLVLAANSATYRLGEPIKLSIGLRNNGATDVSIDAESPWRAARLVITDASGRKIAADGDPSTQDYLSTHGILLGAGKIITLSWMGMPWSDLSLWGYHLTKPGTYRIVGIPTVTGNYLVSDATTVRSNVLVFRVVK